MRSMVMICPKCKCEISEGAFVCKQCGFDLNGITIIVKLTDRR